MDSVREDDLPRLLASDLDRYFSCFMFIYQDRLYNWAQGLGNYTGMMVTAEDVFMETFENAYKWLVHHSAEEIERVHLWRWLHSIARNDFMNHVRKRRPKTDSMDIPERKRLYEERCDEHADEPEAVAERNELREKLYELLDILPLEQRQAVKLKHIKEFTYPEVAEILDIPLSEAKSLVSSGMYKLRKMVSEQEYWREMRCVSIK